MSRQGVHRAALWSAGDVLLRHGLQFCVSIALARLLGPEAFGAIAIIMAVTGLAGVLVDGGFSAALVQKQDVTTRDESTVFWFALAISAALAGLIAAAAPSLATLFQLPDLGLQLAVASLTLVITAASGVHVTLLTKRLDFRTQTIVGGAALVVSGSVAVALAAAGWGVWALIWQSLASASVSTLLYWPLSGWRPRLEFSVASLRSLFAFGGFMLATIMVETIAARAAAFLLGLARDPRALGFYSRAETTGALPAALVQRIVPRVAFSFYVRLGAEPVAMGEQALKAQVAVAALTTPAMLGLSAAAEPLVLALFGEAWAPTAPLLAVIALAGLGMPYQVINLSALMALGRSRRFFLMHAAKKTAVITLIALAAAHGPLAIAWAVTAGAAIGAAADMIVPGRLLGLSAWTQWHVVQPIALAGGLMWAAVAGLLAVLALPAPVELVIGVATGVAVYGGLALLLKIEPAVELLARLRRRALAPAQPQVES